ncbi:F-box/kelch-repeat protein At3g23880-like [Vicia villosa]|uniref:F-box/kelch-repeat protein At3g23880-like n=1 Tax=Vicia villosa TaxID=3911 RepID=UPI00273C85A8|nr:F-box/kelch-repeat protein At3g23880-like [Vicia villosa]
MKKVREKTDVALFVAGVFKMAILHLTAFLLFITNYLRFNHISTFIANKNIQSAASPSPVVLPDDLITKIFSFLPVKSLLRFRCLSKYWKTLISRPDFVKLHLQRSGTRNPLFILITHRVKHVPEDSLYGSDEECEHSVVPYPIRSLLDNPSFTLFDDPYYHVRDKGCSDIVGSCNGLILLAGCFLDSWNGNQDDNYWLRVWNPATRTTSQTFGYFNDFSNSPSQEFGFAFGCDNSTGIYKVVTSRVCSYEGTTEVRVLNLGSDVWRNIESFPVIPLHLEFGGLSIYGSVYLCGTLNWMAINHMDSYFWYSRDHKDITVEQFVIVSLNFGTETYNLYPMPHGFDEVPPREPMVGLLGGCLCFSYSYKETDFVIWKMKKFGVEDSWFQFLKISYQQLQIDHNFSVDWRKEYFELVPLLLSEDGDTLVLKSNEENQAILYNWRHNRVQRTKVIVSRTITDNSTSDHVFWKDAKDFVESLVPIF